MQALDLQVILLLVIFIIVYLSFPSLLMVILYSMLFQVQYYDAFLKKIPVPFGVTKVELETKFKKEEEIEEKNDDSSGNNEEIQENNSDNVNKDI